MAFPVSAARIVESQLTAQNVEKWEAREIRHGNKVAKVLWGGEHFYRLQQMSIESRLRLAAQFLRDKVVINLSIPVHKRPSRRAETSAQSIARLQVQKALAQNLATQALARVDEQVGWGMSEQTASRRRQRISEGLQRRLNRLDAMIGTAGAGKSKYRKTVVDPESRSKPGEFPRADTTLLLKSIFLEGPEWTGETTVECRVGMPLDYGVRLELQMQRSFLVRTLNEEWGQLQHVILATEGAAE